MCVKKTLSDIRNKSLQENIGDYIAFGTLLSSLKSENLYESYFEFKELSDDESGIEGEDEILSFLFDFLKENHQVSVEFKIYFNEKKIIGDAFRIYSNNYMLTDFLTLFNTPSLSFYIHKDISDEGVILLTNDVIIRFERSPKSPYIHQIEGGFKLGSNSIGTARKAAIKKNMYQVSLSDLITK